MLFTSILIFLLLTLNFLFKQIAEESQGSAVKNKTEQLSKHAEIFNMSFFFNQRML